MEERLDREHRMDVELEGAAHVADRVQSPRRVARTARDVAAGSPSAMSEFTTAPSAPRAVASTSWYHSAMVSTASRSSSHSARRASRLARSS